MLIRKSLFFIIFLLPMYLLGANLSFDLIKKGKEDNNTLLVVGGIQGDEPGAFMAASLLSTHYEIKSGSVWIIPNLNFEAIVKRGRGVNGDMNRKFAQLSLDDPEYETVKRIKNYIVSPNIKVVVNLHDGSGFFRSEYIDDLQNPDRWGQTSIIDQDILDNCSNENLIDISKRVVSNINNKLLDKKHIYSVKNTNTRLGDKEMEKSLTYYAINQCKMAFGNEASKNLNGVHERVYYHLLAIESYMDELGIKYKRKFGRSPNDIKQIIDNDISISLYGKKINLPLGGVRDMLSYLPIKKDGEIEFLPSNPLMTIIKDDEYYKIHYGNRMLARIFPSFRDYLDDEQKVSFIADGKKLKVQFGSIVDIKNIFEIPEQNEYRVNIIGYPSKKMENEIGIKIAKKQLQSEYSIDKKGKIYRVEFYKNEKFAGMLLVRFDNVSTQTLTSIASDEKFEQQKSTLN